MTEPDPRRSVLAGFVIGVGMMAAVDEILFHQILAWHHFYDRSTPEVALLSDGLLHSAELVMLIAGGYLLVDLARRRSLHRASAVGGFLLGAGAFQLFDGLINHKVLRVHQVRYDVEHLLPYDAAWASAGIVMLAVGIPLTARAGRTAGSRRP